MKLPIMPVDQMVVDCDDFEERVVRAAFTTRGVPTKDDGYARLRTNKPFKRVTTFEQGCANYVWRMLCFDCVGWGKHVCQPVCADFELCDALDCRDGREDYYVRRPKRRELTMTLDVLIKRVEGNLPHGALKGVIRWGKALGIV